MNRERMVTNLSIATLLLTGCAVGEVVHVPRVSQIFDDADLCANRLYHDRQSNVCWAELGHGGFTIPCEAVVYCAQKEGVR